jgi:hypothetical protein
MYRHVQPCRTEDSGRAKRGISSEANGCELYIKSRAASEHQKVNYQRLIGHLMNRRHSHAAEAVLAASDTEDLPIEGLGPARPPSNPICLGLTSRGIRVRVVRSFSVGPSTLFPTYSTTISSLFGLVRCHRDSGDHHFLMEGGLYCRRLFDTSTPSALVSLVYVLLVVPSIGLWGAKPDRGGSSSVTTRCVRLSTRVLADR